MAVVAKRLAKGNFGTGSAANIYTAPIGSTVLIKAVTICNKLSQAISVTLLFAGTEVIYQHTVKANDTITIPFVDQIIYAGESISGFAGTSGGSNFATYYISGKEVT
ncbi:hypothetical protein HW560_15770 [Paenibacillus sp. E222]|uniref:hypothetical protein n=1 Tax=Paenibacillus sp. E222 TaxID=2748863 RepID=UPI0015C6208A|nr:hypothetical protein [Paenibacillus sp. E222]QLG39405.1 hypothetical protein HW560_15770 [Paenibacillus sp. E222]